jgi:hypothetical protein
MLGPDEYGGAGPSGFVASFRYEHDESWTRVDEIDGRDRRRAEIQAFVSNRLLGAPEAVDRGRQPVAGSPWQIYGAHKWRERVRP